VDHELLQQALHGNHITPASHSSSDLKMVVESMAQTGVEPTYCMGDDIPLAVLSDKSHVLYNYFKQRFAQVCGRFMSDMSFFSVLHEDILLN
jgi:hypothetical protein